MLRILIGGNILKLKELNLFLHQFNIGLKELYLIRNKSLWGGWWIESNDFKFLHLGDTGYTKDFLDIKNKLGKPDLVAIPIGAYKPRDIMKFNHLNPKEAVKTYIDLEAKKKQWRCTGEHLF